MKQLSMRDYELLSAYLDGQLDQAERSRLIARLVKDPALAEAMQELRQTRALLRQTPQRRAPRNFTLTPRMAGIRPPVPRAVPALSWASAVAMFLFLITLGYNLLPLGGFAAAPKALGANDSGRGAGPVAATQPSAYLAPMATQVPATQPPATQPPATQPPATQPPAAPHQATRVAVAGPTPTPAPGGGQPTESSVEAATVTPTPGITSMLLPQATPQPEAGGITSTTESQPPQTRPAFPWPYVFLGLAVVLVGAAFLIRWLNRRAFIRKTRR